ncbi:MAG: ABC transporter ATP-binding protein [Rhodospirillales bacterium]|nr:ABC transporter ATP-binding protein [Rhodospirillales bacterium]
MPQIRAEAMDIAFPLYHMGARSLKKRLLARSPLRLKTDEANRIVVAALRGISFTIARGERVALIGHNGAGKTTLLRTLAGIYEPVAGSLLVEGEIGSLIDPAAGMDAESTGRENIALRCLFRGMDEAETREMTTAIAEFSGLGDFLDVPIRTYSSGMSVRLAFAVATMIEPEILLMDEWFSAGDAAFMAQAQARLERLVGQADILVIATHNFAVARTWCDRAIRLENGQIVADGRVEDVLADA